MTTMNPAAPHHLPVFIVEPSQSDLFLNGAAIFLVVTVLALGSVYFRLHALPEHMAHKNANKLQFEIVAVLALLALFTHNNLFWVAALLLALVPIPDFHGPLATMAQALARMSDFRRRGTSPQPTFGPPNHAPNLAEDAKQQRGAQAQPAEKPGQPLPAGPER